MIKVAVVGCGEQLNTHLESWSLLNNVEIVAVVPINETESESLQATYKNQLVESITELHGKGIDAIDVCVPITRKREIIRQLYIEGVYIIAESPLALSGEETYAIINECKEKNVHLYIGNLLRFSSEYVDARNQVHKDHLGKIGVNRLSVSALHPGSDNNIFLELGIPQFDWLTWTFGKVERVMAKHIKKERPDGSLVEYSIISLRLANKAFTHVELSWAVGQRQTSFELTGDRGMLTVNSEESNPIHIQSPVNIELEEHVFAKSPHQRELEYVVHLIEQQQDSEMWANNAKHAIEIAEAAKESAMTGNPVDLKEGGGS